ncbi:MAG TPA: hypothetical protein VJV96_13200 [Candidatus Angelobacter sp.]|nr:hypothetical protein [Candidatus Angelobacter sp.]
MMDKKLMAIFVILASATCIPAFAQNGSPEEPAAQAGDFAVENPSATKVPKDTILVRGAVPSSTDPVTPVPEGGIISENTYNNKYFGLSYALPPGFFQKYSGPPPSDSGYYVLTQLEPRPEFEAAAAGSVLVSAQDLFFSLVPAEAPLALVEFRSKKLGPEFKIERQPITVKLGKRSFIRFDYMSPVAGLHWYTLTTQVRCHAVQFQFTSRDPELLESMVRQMEKLSLPDEAAAPSAATPVCIRNYATADNVLQKVDPVFTGHRFNRIPVRFVIDKYGKVKYIHVLSAFPDETKAITQALMRWEFRPYRVDGKPAEVETGIVFGNQPAERKPSASSASLAD